nr:tyrosine-protein phosphatase [Aquamicrobium sp.]
MLSDAFRELLDGAVPMALGCAAGKDRTGVGAMLILTALGVSRHEIEADYLRTEQQFETLAAMFMTNSRGRLLQGVDRVAWEPILRSDTAYLTAAYDAIAARNHSVETYLADELGVGRPEVERLRDLLLVHRRRQDLRCL